MNHVNLSGPAKCVYEHVFTPLSRELETIREAKKQDPYGRPPYLKLQTQKERNLWEVKVSAYMIEHGSYFSSVYKMYAGTRNLASNTINASGAGSILSSWSWGYIDPWNCNRELTATALQTALVAFRPAIDQFRLELEQRNSVESLNSFKAELSEMQETIEKAKKTVFYVYRTYDHGVEESESKEELVEQGSGPKRIYEQYEALCTLLNEISLLQEGIAQKIDLLSSQHQLAAIKPSNRSSLQFDSFEAASLWFCKQRSLQQMRVCKDSEDTLQSLGKKTYADLQRTCRLAQSAPEQFVNFAKTIDSAITKIYGNNKALSSQFVGEVFELSAKKLKQEDLEMPISVRPDHFKMWFKELCLKNAPQAVYQAIFTVLMNPEGNGPYRLDIAPSVLNAIMVSDYFSMFEISPACLHFSG